MAADDEEEAVDDIIPLAVLIMASITMHPAAYDHDPPGVFEKMVALSVLGFGFKSRKGGCSLIFAVFNGFRIKWALHCVSVVVGSCEFGDFDCCDVSVNRVDGSDEVIFVGLKIVWEEQCGMNLRMALVIFETLIDATI